MLATLGTEFSIKQNSGSWKGSKELCEVVCLGSSMWTSDVALMRSWWRTIVGCLFSYRVITMKNKHNSGFGFQIIQTYNICNKVLLLTCEWKIGPNASPLPVSQPFPVVHCEQGALQGVFGHRTCFGPWDQEKWQFASPEPQIQETLTVSTCSHETLLLPWEWHDWGCLLVSREGW